MELKSLLFKLKDAFNHRNIETLMDCFRDDYSSEQPIHPDRAFQGPDQVRKNWSSNFNEMPDFCVELISYVINDQTIWAEWDWKGTRRDQTKLHMRGVTIFETENGQIKHAKLYMEPVEMSGTGIETAVKEVMHGKK